jgi:subtilisin family serine protease
MRRILFFIFISYVYSVYAQETYMYRLILKDKGSSPFSLDDPTAFLSQKSIDRRTKQHLFVDDSDLPIDPAYFEAIANTGAHIRTYSKWVNTVVVHLPDPNILPALENLPFVDSLYCVWKGVLPTKSEVEAASVIKKKNVENDINSYGNGFTQISLNNGHFLHEAGFRGEGMTIAILDGGFTNVDVIDYFDQSKILGVKNFNHELTDPLHPEATSSLFDHGTRVLSCMLSARSGEMVGTAPEANYYLFRTEVMSGGNEEFPVEEDYWVAALEYADSLGVDIVTSSLGYAEFDDPAMNHTQSQLDGKTIPISRAAGMAASKGILLFNSAGNEGSKSWEKILFPSDAENIITVGSVWSDSTRSSFSSIGFTADGRIKPDVMAMGTAVYVVSSAGNVVNANGTSFSTPIMAGLGACLWEALPDLTSFEIQELLHETANRFLNPTPQMGFGIADVYKAYTKNKTNLHPVNPENRTYLRVNSSENRLYINIDNSENYTRCHLNIYTGLGMRILSESSLSGSIDISFLPRGIYIAHLQIGDERCVRKFIKL